MNDSHTPEAGREDDANDGVDPSVKCGAIACQFFRVDAYFT